MASDIAKINGIPAIGFGTYPLSGAEAQKAIEMALEVGFRHFDTAQMYGNEAELGSALAGSGLPPQELFVTTKVSAANLDARRFLPSVKRSLEQLRLTRVDLLLIHWPPDGTKQIEPCIDRLNAAAESGLAARIGISNFPVAFMRRAAARSARKLANNQVEFHPLLNQHMLKEAAGELGISLSAYCPLARGAALSQPAVAAIAKRLNESPATVVLRWIIQQGVVALPMTTKRDNAKSNLRALDIILNAEDMDAITALTQANLRIVSPASMSAHWDK